MKLRLLLAVALFISSYLASRAVVGALLRGTCPVAAVPIATVAALDVSTPAAPQAPPCIHETCGERPDRLWCAGWSGFWKACDQWKLVYERHCDCDTWGVVPMDGGAP